MLIEWKETPFDFGAYLDELNTKEITFLYYLKEHDASEELRPYLDHLDNLEDFFRSASAKHRKHLHSLDISYIKNLLQREYEQIDFSVIQRSLNAKGQKSLFNSSILLYALYVFSVLQFKKQITAIEKIPSLNYPVPPDKYDEWVNEQHTYLQQRLLYPKKPHCNILGLLIYLGILREHRENDIEEDESAETLLYREQIVMHLLYTQYVKIEYAKQENLKIEKRKVDAENERYRKENDKRRQQIEKTNEQLKTLKTELKTLQKQHGKSGSSLDKSTDPFYLEMYRDLQRKEKEADGLREQLKAIKEREEKPHPIYESLIERLNEQLRDVRNESNDRKAHIKELTRQLEVMEKQAFIDQANTYFSSHPMTEELYTLLLPRWEEYKEKRQSEKQRIGMAMESSSMEHLSKDTSIGYCSLEYDSYYVIFSDGTKKELTDIPRSMYPSHHQFVRATTDGRFRWLYYNVYQENEYDYQKVSFVSVVRKETDGTWTCLGDNEERISVEGIFDETLLKENQIIAVKRNNHFYRFYPRIYTNADNYMPSIRLKGHTAYFVLSRKGEEYLVRNIETGEETWRTIQAERDIHKRDIITLEGNELVHTFTNAQFYTLSSYYPFIKHGTVSYQNGSWVIHTIEGESLVVQDIPSYIELSTGDSIAVDEDAYFVKKESFTSELTHTLESKLRALSTKRTDKPKEEQPINLNKNVLIIGKITYEQSYREAFRKQGYKAEMVDGYSSWQRVKMKLKNQDVIVVVTNFISHENMWQLKKEALDAPIFFSESDGANQIVEQIKQK